MAEIKTIKTDVVVIGAGIAGLWLANILKNNGINFVLLETDAIGANQTINSQGMLHSGIKYALQGNVTGDMKAISDSEALHLWEQAFLDQSSIKLTENCKLIDHQYLWSNNQLTSKLANFFVSNLLKSKVEKVAPEHLPVPFINKHFNGSVYKLHETVLNLSVLLQELTAPIYQYCLQVNNINLELEVNNNKINKFFIIKKTINDYITMFNPDKTVTLGMLWEIMNKAEIEYNKTQNNLDEIIQHSRGE